MRVPPKPIRRLVIAPLVVAAEVVLVVLSPVILLVALLASPLAGGWRPLRVAVIVLDGLARHLAALLGCLGLWVASGFGRRLADERFQRAHLELMRWFVRGLYATIVSVARVRIEAVESARAGAVLSAHERPVLLLSRHAGEGDTLLVIYELLCPHARGPRIVMHERLRLDPLIDVLGERLPNRFVDPRGGDTERDIAAMASELDEDTALVIFPEGRNFSAAHRLRAIERLEQFGHAREAEAARAMQRVSAPRPGGTLAAIEAAPGADVVVMGHAGFPTGLKEIWRHLPEEQVIEVRLWHEPADAIPRDRDAQIAWLFGWWQTLDAWVAERESRTGRGARG
jgi:1-acyl-sn-glycerol-3-phosphate acyltransferase